MIPGDPMNIPLQEFLVEDKNTEHSKVESASGLSTGFEEIESAWKDKKPRPWITPSLFLLIFMGMASLLGLVTVEAEYFVFVQIGMNSSHTKMAYFNDDPSSRANACAHLCMLPLYFGVLNHLCVQMRPTLLNKTGKCCNLFDTLSFPLFIILVLWELRNFCMQYFSGTLATHSARAANILLTLYVVLIYFEALDRVQRTLEAMIKTQEDRQDMKHIRKTQRILAEFVCHGDKGVANSKDATYSFNSPKVSAEVLQHCWRTYHFAGKALGIVVAMSVFMGFVLNMVLVLSTVAAMGVVLDIHSNITSLFRIAIFQPFYVGDIVTLNTTGSQGHASTSIMGFVESITFSYVVIRNFELKQTWIAHGEFMKMIIQNWSRRPTKLVLLHFAVSSECPSELVRRLALFGKQWIEAAPEIMNGKESRKNSYRKCHITDCKNGFSITVIFFPDIGISHREIRQKFIVDFMAAGKRLKIPFVPSELTQTFPGCEDTEFTRLWNERMGQEEGRPDEAGYTCADLLRNFDPKRDVLKKKDD